MLVVFSLDRLAYSSGEWVKFLNFFDSRTELYDFVLHTHAGVVKRKGSTLVLKKEHYVKVRKGYYGYIDYRSGERGNSIDFLEHLLRR